MRVFSAALLGSISLAAQRCIKSMATFHSLLFPAALAVVPAPTIFTCRDSDGICIKRPTADFHNKAFPEALIAADQAITFTSRAAAEASTSS